MVKIQKKIRKKIIKKRENLSKNEVQERSNIIIENFIKSDLFTKSQNIMSYSSFRNEVETDFLNKYILEKGKKLILPKIDLNKDAILPKNILSKDDLQIGKYGILEPKSSCMDYELGKLDLIIVPGVAFDIKGNRIGFGKGYYDKFLKCYKHLKIAFCYDFQIVEHIIPNMFDIPVDIILTETKKYKRVISE